MTHLPRVRCAAHIILLSVFLLALGACSDDTAESPKDAAADQGVAKEAGPGDGPMGGEGKKGDGPLVDSKQLKPDAKVPAHWTTLTNNPPVVRYHTATLLPNGDVLIVGGSIKDSSNNDVVQKKAYRYQAAKGVFVSAGEMTDARESHDVVLLKNGKVLVTGGDGDKVLAATEIFDPATMKWSQGPKMPQSRWSHRSALLKNGWVLVTGGFGSYDSLSSVVLYDPSSNTFKTPAAAMNEQRRSHTMSLLKNGKVLIAGGLVGSSSSKWVSSGTTEIYDPSNGTFKAGPMMTRPRNGHTATVRADGTLLIVGGMAWKATNPKIANDLFDPVKNTMTSIAYPGPYLPAGHSAMLLKDGRVLVIEDDRSVAFSPKMGGVWDSLPTLPDKRWSNTGTLLSNGTVLVVGGVNNTSPYTFAKTALILHP